MFAKLYTTLVNFTLASIAAASELQKSEKPRLKDWFEAAWFDGVVQIPLTVKESWETIWIADLVMMNDEVGTYNVGGYCAVDNNSAVSVVFDDSIDSLFDDWFDIDNAICTKDEDVVFMEDGAEYDGYWCREKFCLGSWTSKDWDDPHVQVCNSG